MFNIAGEMLASRQHSVVRSVDYLQSQCLVCPHNGICAATIRL